ncbi:jg1207 [Pararge aegeria aegeria]|uniref:Jg1207 protein n=1 Tax=Pararge aegeria aegeria TaxID=348720 RepID=A0A8S4R9W6_9NEOP|nr:jg1207 [Pararge aegeria aegeria]
MPTNGRWSVRVKLCGRWRELCLEILEHLYVIESGMRRSVEESDIAHQQRPSDPMSPGQCHFSFANNLL